MGVGRMGTAVISGVGQSAYARRLESDADELALVAVRAALDDAGINGSDVDGMYSYSSQFETVPIPVVASGIGVRELSTWGEFPLGADAIPAAIQTAELAIASGRVRHVVLYRSMKRRPRPGPGAEPPRPRPAPAAQSFHWPHGLVAPAIAFGLMADRYLTVTGIRLAEFESMLGEIVTAQHRAADNNPAAILGGTDFDLDSYQSSPLYADPLRRADLCLDNDGAAAIVISAAGHRGQDAIPPVKVLAASAPLRPGREPFGFNRDDLHALHHPSEADALFERAGVTRDRVRVAQIYDACSFMVVQGLEGFGFAPEGQGSAWIRDHGLGPDSDLPVNTAGGNLAEAYIHGMNAFIETVRQVRGTSAQPVPDADVSFFGAPTGGAVILGQ